MIELKTKEPVEGGEVIAMIEIFSLDGVVYSIPDKVRPALSLQYLDMARKRGVGIAESWLAEELLGSAAYEALLNFPDITAENWEQAITIARAVAFGEVRPKEKTNGHRSSRTAPTRKRSAITKKESGSST